jgi:hypothetical protein
MFQADLDYRHALVTPKTLMGVVNAAIVLPANGVRRYGTSSALTPKN